MKKMWIAIIVIVVVVLGIIGYYTIKPLVKPNPNVGNHAKLERTFTEEEQRIINTRRFTIEDIAEHNGKGSEQPYVAIDGVVYDVSGIPSWAKGAHHGVKAGTDATEKFVQSAHGKEVLQKMPVAGGLER